MVVRCSLFGCSALFQSLSEAKKAKCRREHVSTTMAVLRRLTMFHVVVVALLASKSFASVDSAIDEGKHST